MAIVQDSGATPKPPLWKVILNIVYQILGGLKAAGKFDKKSGPQ